MSAPKDPTEDPDKESGFLGGWSRRKLAAKRAAEPMPEVVEPPLEVPEAAPEPEGVDDAYIDALPPLDSIGAGSDIKPFLVRGVPEALKNAAMRRLWSTTPGVRDYLDPAVDYAWDWNAPGGVPGGGGVLSPTRVAKMLENLVGGRTPEPEEAKDVIDPDDQLGVDADMAAEAEPAPPVAVRRTDPDAPKAEVSADAASEPQATKTASLPPPRRHGGALPG